MVSHALGDIVLRNRETEQFIKKLEADMVNQKALADLRGLTCAQLFKDNSKLEAENATLRRKIDAAIMDVTLLLDDDDDSEGAESKELWDLLYHIRNILENK